MNKYHSYIRNLIIAILSYLVTISLAQITHFGITGIDIILPGIFAFVYLVMYQFVKVGKIGDLKYASPLGILFSATLVVGSHIDIYDASFTSVSLPDVLYFIILSIFFIAIILLLFRFIEKYGFMIYSTDDSKKIISLTKYYWIVVGILLLCWLPYYLTFFPGNVGRDTIESLNMCLGNIPWSNHHPVFFTFLLYIVLNFTSFVGDINISIAIFSLLQMFIFALTLSYTLLWLQKRHIKKELSFIFLLFFAFHPIVAMYSIYLTKDVLFSCVMLLLTLKIFDLVETKGELLGIRKDALALAGLSLGVIFLRNNGVFIIVGIAVCIILIYRDRWKSILFVFGSIFVLSALYKGPVFDWIGIAKQSFAESASVPLQQIGYVIWTDGEIGDADKEYLNELMPLERVKEVYEPGYTDPYKFDKDFNDTFLNDNVGRFMSVWWNLLPKNFPSYVKAYLMQTVGYWHYGETNSVCTQGVTDNELGISQYDVIQNTLGVSLEPLIEKLVLVARKAPLLCVLSSMAMQIFAVFLCGISYLRKGRKEKILALLPCILLWISIMLASPAFCLLRYMFPLFLLWPIFITELFSRE